MTRSLSFDSQMIMVLISFKFLAVKLFEVENFNLQMIKEESIGTNKKKY